MPIFRPDNSGFTLSEARLVQDRLRQHGFDPGPTDGAIGPRTSAAVSAFKRAAGLLARPYIGPETYRLLMLDPAQANDPAPPWITEGLRLLGWHERANNAELRAWLKSDGHALGDPAIYPWCGDFVETAIRLALPQEPFGGALARNPYWALNWREFGVPCGPVVGAVVSISRDGGGHVGFAIAQDGPRVFVLGGNQSNTVSVAPIEAVRFEAASWRWPSTYPLGAALPYRSSPAASISDFA